jgi:type VI protein secretion system component VasF
MSMPRPGSPEWRANFQRDREKMNRMWPWWVALSTIVGITVLILIITGVLPIWLLFT